MTSLLTRPATVETRDLPPHRLRFGVMGYGYWGPNLARNIATCDQAVLVGVADLSGTRLAAARANHPLAVLTQDHRDLLSDPSIDAIVVATPPETHRDLVIEALESGKHVLVEKPLATSARHAEEMLRVAKACDLQLMVDHTFLFTGAVRRMKRYFEAGDVGEVYYYDSTRINLGLFQHEANVIWDLAPHDISIMLYLLQQPVRKVSAFGACHVDANVENIAYLTLQFDGPLLAHFHVNWLAPAKVRRTIIGGSKKMLVYDDLEMDDKLKVYDSGASLADSKEAMYRTFVEYRTGDVLAPKLEKAEALAVETRHFVNVVRGLEEPVSTGELGLQVVRIIEAAQRSLRSGGAAVEVEE